VKPTMCPTRTWSTRLCMPPMMFTSMVGQASRQTAPASGPSTIERS
jgi:hypothetical protein